MMGLGAAVTAPLALAAKNASDSGAELYDMSRRTGLAVESLSMLDYAASQSGTSLETAKGAIRRMQKSTADVTGLIAALWAAAQTCFIRAGVATEVQKAQG